MVVFLSSLLGGAGWGGGVRQLGSYCFFSVCTRYAAIYPMADIRCRLELYHTWYSRVGLVGVAWLGCLRGCPKKNQ